MDLHDRLFWGFVFLFYGSVMVLAVSLQEAGIAALFGWLFGMSFEIFSGILRSRTAKSSGLSDER